MDFKEWPYLLHLRSICGCWTICKTIHLSVINAHLAQNAVPKRPYRCRIAALSLPYPRPYPRHIQHMGAHIQDMHILPYLIRYPGYGRGYGASPYPGYATFFRRGLACQCVMYW